MTVGISGYGVYIPRMRIKKEDYAAAWGSFGAAGVVEKSVMGLDEDVLTAATKVSKRALESVPLGPEKVTRFAMASTSAPYVEKLLSGTVMCGAGIPSGIFSSDHTTSTRAGTEAMIAGFEHVMSNPAGHALIAVADAPRASMWTTVEHGLGAGAAAYVLGSDNLIAELEGSASYASEHFGERFKTGEDELIHDLNVKKFFEAALMTNTTRAASALLKKLGRKGEEYQHVVIQQPDAKVPGAVGKKLGAQDAQLASSLVASNLGDLGAASTPTALAAALDVAKVGDRILVVSYGSGAGSDAISLKVVGDRKPASTVASQIAKKDYINYVQYLKLKGAIK
ncbi:MAG: hydroxymethylglutaryl-CoA synthase [Thermoplasmata archaeon]|jgi:hydroxymethylglutaryl-CoA synthase|nr:hydroxymethylglutaryl-CoA synthase [Thermoplasmata archaeon]